MGAISQFLSGKTLFLTGATGFLAKGLLVKVLRHAPDVGRVYLLIRPRHSSGGAYVSAQERLRREVFGSDAFSGLRARWGERFEPTVREKVVAVSGDLTQEGLGIDPECARRLAREVDVVINCAATVVFDERIDVALRQNTLGPRRIVEFARTCRDAILLHVSTAYVSGQQTGRIPEAMLSPDRSIAQAMGDGRAPGYSLEGEIESILKYTEQVEEASRCPERQEVFRRVLEKENRGKRVTDYRLTHQMEALRARWVKKQLVEDGMRRARRLGWHDSYTLTKAMGEQLIARVRGDLPTAIVRPSIIESSLVDPEPGWLDGLKVADPLIAHYGKGRLYDFPADPGIVLDLIPVDLVFNTILAALPRVREEKDIQVYHVATGSRNPLHLGEMFDLIYDYFRRNPMRDKQGRPIAVRRWKFPSRQSFERHCRLRYRLPLNALLWAMDHVPAIPWSSRLRHRVSMLEAMLDRVLSLTEIYSPYTNLNCEFDVENTRRLHQGLDEEDRETFNCDVSRIRWDDYIQNIHMPGLKHHVLKTP